MPYRDPIRTNPRSQEMTVRKMADRQEFRLRKLNRRRDPNAPGYGLWVIETKATGRTMVKGDLDRIEAWLRTPRAERRH